MRILALFAVLACALAKARMPSLTSIAGSVTEGANTIGSALMDAHTVAQREACAGCQFVWVKVHSSLDQSAGYAEVKRRFEEACAVMPDVFFDSCDRMAQQQDGMINDYLQGMKFKEMCEMVGLCWTTFPM